MRARRPPAPARAARLQSRSRLRPPVAGITAASDHRGGSTPGGTRRGRPQGGVPGRPRGRGGVARRVPGALGREPSAVDPPLGLGRLRDFSAPNRSGLPRWSLGRRRGKGRLERSRASREGGTHRLPARGSAPTGDGGRPVLRGAGAPVVGALRRSGDRLEVVLALLTARGGGRWWETRRAPGSCA